MDILNFKYSEYDDVFDDWLDALDDADMIETYVDGHCLLIKGYKIGFPQLGVYFRDAIWYARNEDIEDESAEDAWDMAGSVFVEYDDSATDLKEYNSFASCDLYMLVGELCKNKGIPYSQIDSLDCYIELDIPAFAE